MQIDVTEDDLIGLINKTSSKIDKLLDELKASKQTIADLGAQNADLKNKNQIMFDQLKEYIQELEKIRMYYVDSNNNNRR